MNAIAWVAVSVVLILISCIGASLIQTDFGGVTVTDVRLPMPDGETLRVLVHRPATATEDNPAPAVITSHGYHATLETQDITSIELARRGFVVFNMDTYSAGSSSGTTLPYGVSRSYYGLGINSRQPCFEPFRANFRRLGTGGFQAEPQGRKV